MALLLVWLLLLATLALQLHLATLEQLELPDFLKHELQDRLATIGLRVDFAHARFDTSGNVILEDVNLGAQNLPGTLLTADHVSTKLALWRLLVGAYELSELRVTHAALFAPIRSDGEAFTVATAKPPSFKSEAIATDLDFRLRLSGRDLVLPQLTAQIGAIYVNIHGALRLPRPTSAAPELSTALASYLNAARQLWSVRNGASFVTPRIEIHLTPDDDKIAVADIVVNAGGWPDALQVSAENKILAEQLHVGPLRLTAIVPLLAPESDTVEISGSVENVALPKTDFAADGTVSFTVRGDLRRPLAGSASGMYPSSLHLALALGAISANKSGIVTGPVIATAYFDSRSAGTITVDATIPLADVPWDVSGVVDPAHESGRLVVAGNINNDVLALVSMAAGRDLGQWAKLDSPLALRANITLDTGWKLARAAGWFTAGRAVADGVALESAEATFTYADGQLVAPEAMLRTHDSMARGSYEMDTTTLDYRFLLAGKLRPADIDEWLDETWPRFWKNFHFAGAPPEASLDLSGRWGSPQLTTILVAAEVTDVAVRDVRLDHVRARVFLGENWDDVREFSVTRGTQSAQGKFAITEEAVGDRWRRLEFAVTSELDLDAAAKLIGPDAEKFVQSYRFAAPPHLVVNGTLDGQTETDDWTHQRVDLSVESAGDFTYEGFPVRDFLTRAKIQDEVIELSGLTTRAGGGSVAGAARVWTAPGGERLLSFDGKLAGANLGETIRLVENFLAARRGEPAPSMSKFQQQVAAGKLELALTAEGAMGQPFSYHGKGTAAITGADLAQINLFGLLSKLLGRTLLNFSSLNLDKLQTSFALDGGKVTFPDLLLTGASAELKAAGDYALEAGTLDFRVNVKPFGNAHTLVGKTLEVFTAPLADALEVKLQGPLETPVWTFINGPVNVLRTLMGEKEPAPTSAEKK